MEFAEQHKAIEVLVEKIDFALTNLEFGTINAPSVATMADLLGDAREQLSWLITPQGPSPLEEVVTKLVEGDDG